LIFDCRFSCLLEAIPYHYNEWDIMASILDNLPMAYSNTLSIKPLKIQNPGHNFELEQRSSFTAFSLACRQAGMTGWEAARLEKCTGRTVIPIAALQQLRELSTMG
jgi:hypothetical protein